MTEPKFVRSSKDLDEFFIEYEEYEELLTAKKKDKENAKNHKKKTKDSYRKELFD
jgi:hypothetical protein